MTALEDPPEPQDTRSAPTLLRCIGDLDAFTPAWGRHPLLVRCSAHDGRGDFDDVLTLSQLDEYVAMSARTPAVRMVIEGVIVPAHRYCTPVRIGGTLLDDVVDARKVTSLFADGATLVAHSLHRTIPSVARFVGALQDELGHPVQANAYLTPPTATGLSAHIDRHDVIAVQLEGRKSWWVDGLGEIELRPGDRLYVPVGTRHRASTSTDTSLHLTIGIIRVTRRHVLERMLGRAADLDQPLPIGYRHPDRRDELALALDDVLDHALDSVGTADLDDLVDVEQRRRLEPPPEPGRIRSAVVADRIGPDTLVRWVGAPPLVRQAGDRPDPRISLHLGERVLSLPATATFALTELASGTPVRVGDLPALDAPSRLVVARRLVREGACVVDRLVATARG
jgi:mannose-6-phosphate isomerase-like protein (cupin superfamily)